MNNVIRPDAWWQGKQPPPPSGPTEPPRMDLSDRVSKIEAVLPTLATKEDLVREVGSLRAEMHREFVAQTWRFVTFTTTVATALVGAVYYIARHAA